MCRCVMLMPALTMRPVPAQRRLPIIRWSSSTIASIEPSSVRRVAVGAPALVRTVPSGLIVRIE